jgi:hypothetical protein
MADFYEVMLFCLVDDDDDDSFTDLKVKEHLYDPRGFKDVEPPRFPDSRHMKVVRSAIAPTVFTPQEIFLVLIFVRG